jgi:hypothetical protein
LPAALARDDLHQFGLAGDRLGDDLVKRALDVGVSIEDFM